jgi:hypothetical protein
LVADSGPTSPVPRTRNFRVRSIPLLKARWRRILNVTVFGGAKMKDALRNTIEAAILDLLAERGELEPTAVIAELRSRPTDDMTVRDAIADLLDRSQLELTTRRTLRAA